jgi:hypothetical protein
MEKPVFVAHLFRLLFGLSLCAFFGWFGYYSHRRVNPSSRDAIRVPRAIAILFFDFRSDGVLSVSGVMCQLIMYVGVPFVVVLTTGDIGFLTFDRLVAIGKVTIVVMLCMAFAAQLFGRGTDGRR